MPNKTLSQVKSVVREPYAWPGGYPRMVVMADGECLCNKCAKDQFRMIARATIDGDRSGWCAASADINWEDSSLYCAHCGDRIESAYGDE